MSITRDYNAQYVKLSTAYESLSSSFSLYKTEGQGDLVSQKTKEIFARAIKLQKKINNLVDLHPQNRGALQLQSVIKKTIKEIKQHLITLPSPETILAAQEPETGLVEQEFETALARQESEAGLVEQEPESVLAGQEPEAGLVEQESETALAGESIYFNELCSDAHTQVLLHFDFPTFINFSCTSSVWNKYAKNLIAGINKEGLEQLCSMKINIIDAKMLGFEVDDEPKINYLTVFNRIRFILEGHPKVKEVNGLVDQDKGITLLTMPKGLTFNFICEAAKSKEIDIECTMLWMIEKELGNPIESTYRKLFTNSCFKGTQGFSRHGSSSRTEGYSAESLDVFKQRGFEVITFMESFALCMFTVKFFNEYLCEFKPILGDAGAYFRFDLGQTSISKKAGGSDISIGFSSKRLFCITFNRRFDGFLGAGKL